MKNESDYFYKAIFFCLVLVLFTFGHWCYMQGRASVSNHGAGADSIRTQLDSAGTTAKATTESISGTERTAQEAQGTVRTIENIVATNGTAIENSKRILAGVRQRGKVEATTR